MDSDGIISVGRNICCDNSKFDGPSKLCSIYSVHALRVRHQARHAQPEIINGGELAHDISFLLDALSCIFVQSLLSYFLLVSASFLVTAAVVYI